LWFPELPIRPGLLYNYFVTGEDDKANFSIPGDAATVESNQIKSNQIKYVYSD
jgi:hypothetical protein